MEKETEKYRPTGQKYSRHGRVFQVKLLMLFLNRGCKRGYKFSLATEIEGAKAFDDVLFKYKDGNDIIYRFVQAKHVLEEDRMLIKYSDLLGDKKEERKGNFHLLKYFQSFLEIRENGKAGGIFDNLKLKDLVIYTNFGIDFDDLTTNGLSVKKLNDTDDILDDEPVEEKIPERYQLTHFPNDKKDIFYDRSDVSHQMAKDLARKVCKGLPIDLGDDNFRRFRKALIMENIIDVTTKKLHEHFLQNTGLSDKAKEFYNTFLLEGMKQNKTSREEFLEEIQSKDLNMSKEFCHYDEELDEELPTDRVNNEVINEYFKYFTLAVNQPNSEQLDQIIKKELCEEFNIQDIGLIMDPFYFYMWKWMTESRGRFLSDADLQNFYEDAKKRLKKLSIVGVRSNNPEKNLNFGEFFEDVSEMEINLNSAEHIINIVASKSTTLAFIKVFQSLEKLPFDSFAAVDVNFLLSNEEKYLTAFDFKEPFIMVVEWPAICNHKEGEVNKLVENILRKIKPEHKQKLVLISRSVKLDEEFKDFTSQTMTFNAVETKFCHLTADAQSRMLSTKIIFHDRKCILKELINGNTDCITEEIIDMAINEQNLVINKNADDLGEIQNYYIERKFRKYLKHRYTCKCIIEDSVKYVFAISDTSKEGLLVLMPNEKICNFGDNDYTSKHARIIVVQNQAQYRLVCNHYQPHASHHLKKEGDGFIRLASSTSPELQGNCSEDELLLKKDENKLTVIASEHGTGKSTLFKHLAMSLTHKSLNYWVLLINWKNFIEILRNRKLSSPEDIIDFILETQELKHSFEKAFLRFYILVCGKIVIFFQGFDDCQQYECKVISMLKYLETTKIEAIYVSTQLQSADKLEAEKSWKTYEMLPFSIQDYAVFLKNIWKRNFKMQEKTVEDRLDIFVGSLVRSFAESASLLTSIILKFPLHAQMIADVFQEQLEEHIKSENPKLQLNFQLVASPATVPPFIPVGTLRCNTGFDLLELYRTFIKHKIKMSLGGKMQLEDKTMQYVFEEIIRPRIVEMLENVAICMLFPEETHKIFKAKKESPNLALEEVALVRKVNAEYCFIHPTFAQFFAAQKIVNLLGQYDKDSSIYKCITGKLKTIMFIESSSIFRMFIDSMLVHDSEIHFAAYSQNIDFFKGIVSQDSSEIHKRDALDRTPMHYVSMNNAVDIGNFIIDKDASCVADIDALHFDSIIYASVYFSPQMLQILFKVGTNVNGFETNLKTFADFYNNQNSINAQFLAKNISEYASDDQKRIIVNSFNYKFIFGNTMKNSNYTRYPTFFLFACKAHQREMLIQNEYEIARALLKRNPAELWQYLKNCIDDEMKDNIPKLEEYETKFRHLVKSDVNQLQFLVKMANRKQLENLWGKKGYAAHFRGCANVLRSDIMYDLMQIFKGENLFSCLGPKLVDYFERLFSEKQFYWAGKLFECTNSEQRKQLLKNSNWQCELYNALETNDYNAFDFLLNCVTNKAQRQKLLKYVKHEKIFKTAVSENDLEKLIVLSFCNDDECRQLTESMQEEDYCQLFRNNIDRAQSLFLLSHYTTIEERKEIFHIAQCPNYLQETIEVRIPPNIQIPDKNDERLLDTLRPNARIQENCGKKWSVWGRLLYFLCKKLQLFKTYRLTLISGTKPE